MASVGVQTLTGVGATYPDDTWSAPCKLKDGQGRYLMQLDPTADSMYRVHIVQVVVMNRLPQVAVAVRGTCSSTHLDGVRRGDMAEAHRRYSPDA